MRRAADPDLPRAFRRSEGTTGRGPRLAAANSKPPVASALKREDAVTLRMWTAPRDLPTGCGPTAKRSKKALEDVPALACATIRSLAYKEVMPAPLGGEF